MGVAREEPARDMVVEAEVPIAVRDHGGDGPPLVLLHGAGGNLAQLGPLAERLRARHRVVALDLRGHGLSGDGPWSVDAALADVEAVVAALALDRPAVVGVSLGGMLAARWAARRADCPGAVSLDGVPVPRRPEQLVGLPRERAEAELARLHGVFAGMTQAAAAPLDPAALPELTAAHVAAGRAQGLPERDAEEAFTRNLARNEGGVVLRPRPPVLAGIRDAGVGLDLDPVHRALVAPLLLVLATEDLPAQRPFAELYAAYRRGVLTRLTAIARTQPLLRVRPLPGATHAMAVEQAAELGRLIEDFLADPARCAAPSGEGETAAGGHGAVMA